MLLKFVVSNVFIVAKSVRGINNIIFRSCTLRSLKFTLSILMRFSYKSSIGRVR